VRSVTKTPKAKEKKMATLELTDGGADLDYFVETPTEWRTAQTDDLAVEERRLRQELSDLRASLDRDRKEVANLEVLKTLERQRLEDIQVTARHEVTRAKIARREFQRHSIAGVANHERARKINRDVRQANEELQRIDLDLQVVRPSWNTLKNDLAEGLIRLEKLNYDIAEKTTIRDEMNWELERIRANIDRADAVYRNLCARTPV
jgi:chromosome segregation ATPase